MRKIQRTLALVMSFLLIITLFPVSALGESADDFAYGDVDADGNITAADARLIIRAAVGFENFLPESREFKAGDINGSGSLTAADARFVLRTAVELEYPLTEPISMPDVYTYSSLSTAKEDAELVLLPGEDDGDSFSVLLVAKNCIGLKSADFEVLYDANVISSDWSVDLGDDAAQFSNTKSHNFVEQSNDEERGVWKISFYDKDQFVDHDTFAEDSRDEYEPVDINAEELECLELWFNKLNGDFASTMLQLQMKETSGIQVSSTTQLVINSAGKNVSGDVDQDGIISAADARLVLRRAVDLENFPEGSDVFIAADMDLDGKITAADARLILRESVGLENLSDLPSASEVIRTEKTAFEAETNLLLPYELRDDGDTVTLTVWAKNAVGLKSFDAVLYYDTSSLEFSGDTEKTDALNLLESNYKYESLMYYCGENNGMLAVSGCFREELLTQDRYESYASVLSQIDVENLPLLTVTFTKKQQNVPAPTLDALLRIGGETLRSHTAQSTIVPVEICAHTNTTEVEAVPATCVSSGYTQGVFCLDCETYIEGHEPIPALGHIDENCDGICDVCSQLMDPEIRLVQMDSKNGLLRVGIYYSNCEGLKTLDATLEYDNEILSAVKHSVGADGSTVGRDFVSDFNLENPGYIRYASFFREQLWDAETWKDLGLSVNASFFEADILYFEVKDPDADSTELCFLSLCTDGVSAEKTSLTIDLHRQENQCPHENTVETEGRAETCVKNGVEAGVYCLDCKTFVSGGGVLFAPGHTDANADTVCDICADSTLPTFRLYSLGKDENGSYRVLLSYESCIDLRSLDLEILFDADVLRFNKLIVGKDARITADAREYYYDYIEREQGELRYSAYFRNALWEPSLWWTSEKLNVNAYSFEAAELIFDCIDPDATSTTIDVEISDTGDISAQGGTLTLKIKEDHTHIFEWVVDKAATCGETGLKHEECTVCHEKRSENTVIPATGEHQWKEIVDKPATCGETGLKHEECTVCHEKRNENTVIPATGEHTYGEWTVTTPATYTAEGTETRTCSVCGFAENRATAKLEVPVVDTDTAKEAKGKVYSAPNQTSSGLLKAAGDGAKLLKADGTEAKKDDALGSGMVLVKPDGTKETIIVKGDNDGDGKVTAADARYALRSAVELETPNAWKKDASLVEGGEKITASDARLILRAAVGLEKLKLY